jgi:hypothetical protein
MKREGEEKMQALANDSALFNYVRTKESHWSNTKFWILSSLACGLAWGLIMWIVAVVATEGEHLLRVTGLMLAAALAFSALWGALMHLWLVRFARRLTSNLDSDKPFIAAEPDDLGTRITRIPCNHQEGRIAIGGKLIVYEGGLCFIPHRWNWFVKKSVLKAAWPSVGRIYMNSGYLAAGRLYSGGIRDRLAVEVDGQDHFFVVENVDKLVDDLDTVRAKAVG